MNAIKAMFYIMAIAVMLVFLWPLIDRGAAYFNAGFDQGLHPAATSPAPEVVRVEHNKTSERNRKK